MSPIIQIALVLLLFAALYFIIRLKKRLWYAHYLMRIREHERQTVVNFLNEIGGRITKRLELDKTLEMVVDFCIKATKADAGAIFLRDSTDPDVLQARVVQGLFPPLHEVRTDKLISRRKFVAEYVKKEKLGIGEGIIGTVAKTGETVLIRDASSDPRVPRSAGDIVPLRDLILAPLAVRGEVLGVLVLINKRDENRPQSTFDEVDRDLVTALADQASVTLDIVRLYEEFAAKQRLEQELRVAHEFQERLLPSEMPQLDEVEVFGLSQPALEVGGDYFDFIEVDADHLGVVVGDVAGKGIPGALVMATLRSILRAEAPGRHSPRHVLRRVNALITRDVKENIFISATYGILNLRTGQFRFCRAGHEPLMCCRAEESQLVHYEPDGIVLGMVEGELFDRLEEREIDLKSAGTVVLYTDGVPEAMNPQAEEYGQKRFEQVVRNCASEGPRVIIDAVLRDIGQFTRGIPQHDDITLVVLRWKDRPGREEAIRSAVG